MYKDGTTVKEEPRPLIFSFAVEDLKEFKNYLIQWYNNNLKKN